MTTLLQFKQGDSGTTLNLNSSSTGFRLEEDGWNPVVATPVYMGDPMPVLEKLDLLLSNTSQDNIAANMQSLHEMQVVAEQYMKAQVAATPVWLHAQLDGETGERRALVQSITIQYQPSWFGAGAATINIPLVITVVRGPYWENPTVRRFPNNQPSAAAAVKYDYTASGTGVAAHDIVGDIGARIEDFRFQSDDQIGRAWFGIRSANMRSSVQLSNFELIWELENGTNNASESGVTDQADANASGGNVVRVVETDLNWDDEWQKVLYIDVADITATNADDQQGLFLWLLRTYAASGTWEVQLRYGYKAMFDDKYIKGKIVEVANTGYAMKEMDLKPIPLSNIRMMADFDTDMAGGCSIQVWARRTSGSGNFFVDCLCPIPIDEGFIKVVATDNTQIYELGQDPRLQSDGWVTNATPYLAELGIIESWENFVLPLGDGYIVCVHEYVTQPDITDQISFNPTPADTSYYERWLSLRGSE